MVLVSTTDYEVPNNNLVIDRKKDPGISKAFIPEYLYKPPYGFPRNTDLRTIRKLAATPYVHMIVRTLAQQVGTTPWEVRVKEEFQEDGKDYTQEINEVTKFFKNPNDNDDSWEDLLVGWATDILELDSGVGVKVFNKAGTLTQVVARDGAVFLKNPDVYGMFSQRAEIIPPLGFDVQYGEPKYDNPFVLGDNIDNNREKFLRGFYDANLKQKAAYFQYGWTAGRMPIPFGKREIMWFQSNKRTDTIYGRSPVQVLGDVLFTLLYGSSFSLDMFINNNIPAGVIQLIGANTQEIQAFKDRFESKFIQKDVFSNQKKQWWNAPTINQEAKWTPFNFNSKEMQVLESQFWYLKIAAACFGLTPSELGFTEDSNKAVDMNQSTVFKRKALAPLLRLMQHRINTQLMPEFGIEALEYVFDDYDFDEDKKRHDLLDQEIRMGVKTPEMAAQELGVNIEELVAGKEEERKKRIEEQTAMSGFGGGAEDEESYGQQREEKSLPENELVKLLDKFFVEQTEEVIKLVEQLPSEQLSNIKSLGSQELLKKITTLLNPGNILLSLSKLLKKEYVSGLEEVEEQFDRNFLPDNNTINALEGMTFDNIKGLTDEYRDKLRGIIQRGALENKGSKEIATEIRDKLDMARNRSEMIARTEMNRVRNEGSLQGALDTGLALDKVWDAHLDSRTSPVCKHLNNKRVDIKEKFEYKGETFMKPPAHVNCRSRLLYISKEEKL